MNMYIHKYIVLKAIVIYKSLVCIKFLQMIVICPESLQTFTWGESQNSREEEVIGMLVGNFLENPKKCSDLDFKALKNTQIACVIP